MTKLEFKSRFYKAITFSREFCGELIGEEMPEAILIDFAIREWGPEHKGRLKIWGGRLIDREELQNVAPEVAWKHLWVDGKVPYWINVQYESDNEAALILTIRACKEVTDNDEHLYHAREGNPPFHVLGPGPEMVASRHRTRGHNPPRAA